MEKDKEARQNEANRGQGPGRKDDQKDQQADISNVDRQEGEMNNGELGGNFDQKREEEAK